MGARERSQHDDVEPVVDEPEEIDQGERPRGPSESSPGSAFALLDFGGSGGAAGIVVVLAAAGAAFVLPLALVAIGAGPLVAALVHCAVVVTRTDEAILVKNR